MTARARKKPLLVMPPLACQIAGCSAEYAAIGDYADTLRAAELGGWRYCIFDDDGERLIGAWACPDHRHALPWWPGRRIVPPLPVREPGATTAEFLGVAPRAALPAAAAGLSLPGLGAQGEPATGLGRVNTGQGHNREADVIDMGYMSLPADVQSALEDDLEPPPLPQRKPAGPPAHPWQAAMDAELSPEALAGGVPLATLAPDPEDDDQSEADHYRSSAEDETGGEL